MIEEAEAFAEYLEVEPNLVRIPSDDQSELKKSAKEIRVNPNVVSNRITLLTLPKRVQKLIEDDLLGTWKAEIIARRSTRRSTGSRRRGARVEDENTTLGGGLCNTPCAPVKA